MLLIIEILMLVAGIMAISTGKIPPLLFGGPKYQFDERGVRLLGAILILPLPLAFMSGVFLALVIGEQASSYALILELVILLAAGVAAIILSRFIRKPVDSTADEGGAKEPAEIESLIGNKAQGSLIYALLGLLGFTAIVVCPLAFFRARQALDLIDRHQVGERYRSTANAACILAAVIFLFYAALATFFLVIGISVL